jgi:predicted acylesterase/phospholipase RssA
MSQEFGIAAFRNGVNLALGGGGAKGFVHLGVLEALAETGIEIKAVVGTSIGAIIGALFAHYSTSLFREREHPQLEAARALTDLFLREDFWRYADWNLFSAVTRGALGGAKISDWLKDKLTDQEKIRPIRFGELKFPLTITATDAHSGDCLILNAQTEGSMFVHLAIRASMSIQGIFREITLDVAGRPHLCWDGGTTGNCRFDVANRLYPGRPTIASSLTYRGEVVTTHSGLLTAPLRPLRVLNHTTSIMMRAVEAALREAIPASERANTIFVEPRLEYSRGQVSTYDFNLKREYREELVENGRLAVRGALCPA